MAQSIRNLEDSQEFWKPVVPSRSEPIQEEKAGHACERCGTDFVMGSRFCHVCGADRNVDLISSSTGVREWFDFACLRDTLGQTTGSLIALFLGLACVVAAILTGFLYTATTLLDWQAVQIWRIEWLLGATALFVAGLLLRKRK